MVAGEVEEAEEEEVAEVVEVVSYLWGKFSNEISKSHQFIQYNLIFYVGKTPLCLFIYLFFRKAIFKSWQIAMVIMLSFNSLFFKKSNKV